MAEPRRFPMGIIDRHRERKLEKRRRTGPSPERQAERHVPGPDSIDVMLNSGGVQRESRFKPDK